MSVKKFNKNLLPLLAFTVLVLSVGVIKYSDTLIMSDKNTQRVLSESDEKEEDIEKEEKDEDKVEKIEDKESERTETRSVESEKKVETTKKPEVKLNRVKVEVEEESKIENSDDSNLDEVENENNDNETNDQDEVENEQEVESEFEQEIETKSDDGTTSRFKLKTKSKIVDGKTVVETTEGEIEVENSPEDVVNDLVINGIFDTPLAFETKTEDNKVKFEFKGTDTRKILGLFKFDLPKTVVVDANTGEILYDNQTVWEKFLSLISN